MGRSAFDPTIDELPDLIPIFPLQRALLLPGGRLPLNIFEPRYLAMLDDVLSSHRMIGMVQPSGECGGAVDATHEHGATLYRTGCAGRISAFNETEDGRYLITLFGVIRFDIEGEVEGKPYRRAVTNYQRFHADLEEDARPIDRERLLTVLSDYFEATGIEGDWETIKETENERLVTSLAMICPFEPPEKQALLEAMTLPERADTMTAIMEMSTHEAAKASSSDGDVARH